MSTLARRRGGAHHDFTWPGYVDALASLLMVLIFLLAFYSIAQFVLTDAISGRDSSIDKLNREVASLADLLSVERDRARRLDSDLATLALQLKATQDERDRTLSALSAANAALAAGRTERERLSAEVDRLGALAAQSATERDRFSDEAKRLAAEAGKLAIERDALTERIAGLLAERERAAAALRAAEARSAEIAAAGARSAEELRAELERQRAELTRMAAALAVANNERGRYFADLTEEQKLSAEQKAAVVRLTAEIAALKGELSRLAALLDAADARARDQQAQIVDLGQRLNRALASRVEELSRYRSEFFGRLRQALAGRSDITIVGDRFVFQSEVLFESSSADLQPEGERQMAELASRLREIMVLIPPEIDWVLQVDGHTDGRPIKTARFPSNWELSTARAAAVVKFLISQGIPSERLAAAGYAEYRPLVAGDDRAARARNRRIELKLTDR